MRIHRILPLAVGLAVATIASVAPASAETVFRFSGDTEYRDSISINHWARKSKLGAMPREEAEEAPSRRERASSRRTSRSERRASRSEERVRRAERQERSRSARRMARDDNQADEAPRSRRRGARVASLGSSGEAGWSSSGSHGVASYYWQPQRVASGGWFNPNAMTAAHKTLPFGTRVRVTHTGNGRSVIVRINDRGPYIRGRTIDLSRAAAGVIGMMGQGVARIRMDVIGR